VRQLLDGFYFHDANVLNMGQRGDTFVIVLQLDVPPNDLLTITYSLVAAPQIRRELFPASLRSPQPQWLHEELELIRDGGQKHFVHTILFSNGWQVRLPFREVQLTTAAPIFPVPRGAPGMAGIGSESQIA
jgi:hypothetical protein